MNNSDISKLLADYLEQFPQEQNSLSLFETNLAGNASIISRSNTAGHVTASGLVIKDGKGLLIFHNLIQKYLQPGGHIEDDATVWQSAQREVLEETGLNVTLHNWHKEHNFIPININIHTIPYNDKKNEAEHLHYDFMYVFSTGNDEVILQSNEVTNSKWIELGSIANDIALTSAVDKIREHNILF